MRYDEWEAGLSANLRADPLWRMKAYRLSLFLSEIGANDAQLLVRHAMYVPLSSQLTLAIASIGANIAEGYSRSSWKDRARFFEYALGSAREARHFYYAGRLAIPVREVESRIDVLNEVSRLLVATIRAQRVERRLLH